jgi:hypothetical protein
MENNEAGNFGHYQFYILKELEKLNEKMDLIEKDMHQIRVEVASLKVKAALSGTFAGIIITVIGYLLNWFGGK